MRIAHSLFSPHQPSHSAVLQCIFFLWHLSGTWLYIALDVGDGGVATWEEPKAAGWSLSTYSYAQGSEAALHTQHLHLQLNNKNRPYSSSEERND